MPDTAVLVQGTGQVRGPDRTHCGAGCHDL